MFTHDLDLALRSLGRNRTLIMLMIVAVALGLGASMTMLAVPHVSSGDSRTMAVGLNMWLMTPYEIARIPMLYVAVGVLLMLALGQLAVFVSARRASNVPPVMAMQAV